ncbi:MAG TPA: LysM peptidoglycan-binding domain-containing protein, partial [Parachlamydiaceae bacterium]|nr:LysM peptidoglycan-binding domain-containing protein [Parachlamydiaceae bacterium]
SNKIIALREEAHQNSKRLHALQIAVLSTEREKENREIEKLKKNLEEDRREAKHLQTSFSEIQKNIQVKETQIADLELTIDTLFDQLEFEKKQNSHLKNQFESQLAASEQYTAEEKGSLKNTIYELEAKQDAFKKELKEHLAQIDQLESELTAVNLAAIDKELETDSLTEQLKAKKLKLDKQSKDLSFVIETERLALQHTQKELYYAEAELAALSQAFLEAQEKSTEQTVNGLHALSIHEKLADGLIGNLQKKQTELKQLKNMQSSLLHDRNSLKKEIEEKTLRIADFEEKAALFAAKNEALLQDIETFKNWMSEKESLAQIDEINAQTMLAHLRELESLLEIRENELLLTQEAFENKRESEKRFAEQLEVEQNLSLALKEEHFLELNGLRALLNQKEEQINENKNSIVNQEMANEQLNHLLADHQNKIAKLENSHLNATSLNEEINQELDRYRAALDEALTLHEKERQTARELEEKLRNLDILLNEKEEELSYAKNRAKSHDEINMQLAREVDERQEMFKQALSHYEEAKNQTVEKEKELEHLTELLLHRENEIHEIRHMVAETEKNNEKLSSDIKKHHEDLQLSLEQKKEADLKRKEAESSLVNLTELLKTRENELLEARATTSQDKLENERLASEIELSSRELQETLAKYNVAQQKSDENDQQLNALIEKLMNREKDLLKMLEEETIKHAGFESNLDRLDQSRKSLQTELDKARANYASLLNGFNETKEMPIMEMLKSHIVVPGDTLRGISLRYYGSPNRWKEIYHANQANIKNQDQIPVGTKLTIP